MVNIEIKKQESPKQGALTQKWPEIICVNYLLKEWQGMRNLVIGYLW
ncbi:hypothetical protein [Xenorhabdus entomophaga]